MTLTSPLLERAPWTDLTVEEPADTRTGLAVGAVAVLTDLAVRSGVRGVAGSLLVLAVSAASWQPAS